MMNGQRDTAMVVRQIQDALLKQLTAKMSALPDGFNKDRFVLNSVTMLNDMMKDEKKRDNLSRISPASIVMCLMKGAFLGLDFLNGECYAIPYGNEMQFQTDYKGECKICKKHSINPIKDIFAKVVREGDEFLESVEDGRQKISFSPIPFSNNRIIGAFAIVTYVDGSMLYETMSAEEIEGVRNNYSKAKNSPAWTKSTGEMYKKTVLRRLCKLIELDFDRQEQITAFSDGSGMQFDNISSLATSQPLAIAEQEKPVDVIQQIMSQQKAPAKEPVEVQQVKPAEISAEEEFEQFAKMYNETMEANPDNELPFR